MKIRKDGRYEKKYKMPDGTYKPIYGYSPEEIDEKIYQIKYEYNCGLVVGDSTTMNEWAVMWFKTTKEGKVAYSTEYGYKNVINVHIIPYFENMTLKDIKPIHIQAFMNSKNDKSKALQHKILTTLRQIFKSAILNGLISINPAETIKEGGIETEEKIPLTKEEQNILLEAVKGERVELFVNIALYCGLRRGEILALKWEDVNIVNGTITINKAVSFVRDTPFVKPPKTKAGNRVVPLPLTMIKLLCKAKKPFELIVPDTKGKLMSKMAYRRLWDIVINKLQKPIECDKILSDSEKRANMMFKVTPHKLRHTYCTMLYNAGIDLKAAQNIMGHADISVTAEIYTHLENTHIVSAKDKINTFISS